MPGLCKGPPTSHRHHFGKFGESSQDGLAAVGGEEGEELVAAGVGGPEGGELMRGAVLQQIEELDFAALGHLAFAEIVEEQESGVLQGVEPR